MAQSNGEGKAWNPQAQPDFTKLTKLERLLAKIENDIQKRVKDQDRVAFLETLKKVHDIAYLYLSIILFYD